MKKAKSRSPDVWCSADVVFPAQAKAEFADYYRNSLRYLACVDIEKDLTAAERIERAHDLGIAALLGQSIYNFGELVRPDLHPFLTLNLLLAVEADDS